MSCNYSIYTGTVGTSLPPKLTLSPMLLDSIPKLDLGSQDKIHEEVLEMLSKDGSFDADILFLGAGPGGYVGAIRAGRMGAKTVIIEKAAVGGTCLNVGCIPTKALLSTVEVVNNVKRAADFGIEVGGFSIDFPKIIDRKDKIVQQLRKGVELLLKRENVRVMQGTGKIVDQHTVEVEAADGSKERITAKNIIIATGSVPALLPLPGFEVGGAVWTSTEALSARSIPKSLLVVGGGYVGLEFGYAYAKLGTEVTVVEMLPKLLINMDNELAKELEKSLKKTGLKIKTSAAVLRAEDSAIGKKVTFKNADGVEEEIEVEKVLLSIGRKPNTANIGLESVGISTERGRIIVNDRMQTNVSGIYAIGDCVGNPMLAHVAFHEATVAVANCFGEDKHMSYKAVPGVVFTHPEVASVGMTEEDARERYGDENIRVGKFPFIANGKALGMGEKEGFAKVIADAKYGEILGVHIIGPHATDMITEATLAIQSEATIDDIEATIHPHPTLSEPIHEAALDTQGMALHKGA
ncbi:MAG: dihydrolipoyl dehydrogenase [Armatimonadota bacterium]